MVDRILKRKIKGSAKSILLLGPRQVGKSTLISELKPDLSINLADEFEFLKYSTHLKELEFLIAQNRPKITFVDEIQRLPSLLNSIQALLDKNKNLKFYLTGSSARKLRRGRANLLPGRIFSYQLGTLTASELGKNFDTRRALSLGTLPEIYLNKNTEDSKKLLKTYVATYLKEEIKAEALVRNLDSFARFLNETVSLTAQFIDFSKLAKKAKISRHAVPRYFEILEDTMVGYRVNGFSPLIEREDLIRHPKFYFFDVGIYNSMLLNFEPSLDRIGVLSENLVFNQLMHSAWSVDKDIEINSFRTRKGIKVDFIVKLENSYFGIEVKNSDAIKSEDVESLNYFKSQFVQSKGLFIFHMGKKESKFGPVWALPLAQGLKEIGL